jgi:hypothetical protein
MQIAFLVNTKRRGVVRTPVTDNQPPSARFDRRDLTVLDLALDAAHLRN